MFPSVCNFFHA